MISNRSDYKFISPPQPKTQANPKGVTIDGSILPKRIGTARENELHGEDIYFPLEGSYERKLAYTQFFGRSAYDPYVYSRDNILTGEIKASRYQDCVMNFISCFSNGFIDNEFNELNEIYDATSTDENNLDKIIGVVGINSMSSNLARFERGMPIRKQDTLDLFNDLNKLTRYVAQAIYLNPGSQDNGYMTKVDATTWETMYGSSSSIKPPFQSNIILNGRTTQDDVVMYQVSQGTFSTPSCGKEFDDVVPYFGTTKKIYGFFQVDITRGTDVQNKFYFSSINFSTRLNGTYYLSASDVVVSAKRCLDKDNLWIDKTYGD